MEQVQEDLNISDGLIEGGKIDNHSNKENHTGDNEVFKTIESVLSAMFADDEHTKNLDSRSNNKDQLPVTEETLCEISEKTSAVNTKETPSRSNQETVAHGIEETQAHFTEGMLGHSTGETPAHTTGEIQDQRTQETAVQSAEKTPVDSTEEMLPHSTRETPPNSTVEAMPHWTKKTPAHSAVEMLAHSTEETSPNSIKKSLALSIEDKPPHSTEEMLAHGTEKTPAHTTGEIQDQSTQETAVQSTEEMLAHSTWEMPPHSTEESPTHSAEEMLAHRTEETSPNSIKESLALSIKDKPPHSTEEMLPHSTEESPTHSAGEMLAHRTEETSPNSIKESLALSIEYKPPHSTEEMLPHSTEESPTPSAGEKSRNNIKKTSCYNAESVSVDSEIQIIGIKKVKPVTPLEVDSDMHFISCSPSLPEISNSTRKPADQFTSKEKRVLKQEEFSPGGEDTFFTECQDFEAEEEKIEHKPISIKTESGDVLVRNVSTPAEMLSTPHTSKSKVLISEDTKVFKQEEFCPSEEGSVFTEYQQFEAEEENVEHKPILIKTEPGVRNVSTPAEILSSSQISNVLDLDKSSEEILRPIVKTQLQSLDGPENISSRNSFPSSKHSTNATQLIKLEKESHECTSESDTSHLNEPTITNVFPLIMKKEANDETNNLSNLTNAELTSMLPPNENQGAKLQAIQPFNHPSTSSKPSGFASPIDLSMCSLARFPPEGLPNVPLVSSAPMSIEGHLKKEPEWCDVGIFKGSSCLVTSYYAPSHDHTPEHENMTTDNIPDYSNCFKINIEPGAAYKFRICAINSRGRGEWSEVSIFKACVPGYPSAPSSIKIFKSPVGVQLSWEPVLNPMRTPIEYSVCLAVKKAETLLSSEPRNQRQHMCFIRVYYGPNNRVVVPNATLAAAHIDTTSTPAIIFRIAARNDKGFGPATQVRWLQDVASPTGSFIPMIKKEPIDSGIPIKKIKFYEK